MKPACFRHERFKATVQWSEDQQRYFDALNRELHDPRCRRQAILDYWNDHLVVIDDMTEYEAA
jgi:hypothetical protein